MNLEKAKKFYFICAEIEKVPLRRNIEDVEFDIIIIYTYEYEFSIDTINVTEVKGDGDEEEYIVPDLSGLVLMNDKINCSIYEEDTIT